MEYEQVCHWSCWSRHMQADRWWMICLGAELSSWDILFVWNMYTIHLIYQSDISRGHLHLITGYYRDGVPVYGLCKDSSGMVSLEIFWHFILQFYYFWKNHRWWAPVTRAQALVALQWHMFVSSNHLHPTPSTFIHLSSNCYIFAIHPFINLSTLHPCQIFE